MVLLILAIIWAAVLIPPRLRARAEGRPADSIAGFRRHLGVLQRTGPHAALPPVIGAYGITQLRRPSSAAVVTSFNASSLTDARRRRTQSRRREVFMGLVISMGATLVLGLLPNLQMFLAIHVALDVLFMAYVGLLVHMKSLASERTAKVRYLPARPMTEPALLLRRTGN